MSEPKSALEQSLCEENALLRARLALRDSLLRSLRIDIDLAHQNESVLDSFRIGVESQMRAVMDVLKCNFSYLMFRVGDWHEPVTLQNISASGEHMKAEQSFFYARAPDEKFHRAKEHFLNTNSISSITQPDLRWIIENQKPLFLYRNQEVEHDARGIRRLEQFAIYAWVSSFLGGKEIGDFALEDLDSHCQQVSVPIGNSIVGTFFGFEHLNHSTTTDVPFSEESRRTLSEDIHALIPYIPNIRSIRAQRQRESGDVLGFYELLALLSANGFCSPVTWEQRRAVEQDSPAANPFPKKVRELLFEFQETAAQTLGAVLKYGRLQAFATQLQQRAETDGLTNLYNRSSFDERLSQLCNGDGAVRDIALILVDLDHFKSVNDRYGHLAGDAVLRDVAQKIQESLPQREVDLPRRKTDPFAARYGGEELAIVLPNTDLEHAAQYAERLRDVISDYPVSFDGRKVSVTASMGLAVKNDGTMNDLVKNADSALYTAKDTGRNCVVVNTNAGVNIPYASFMEMQPVR